MHPPSAAECLIAMPCPPLPGPPPPAPRILPLRVFSRSLLYAITPPCRSVGGRWKGDLRASPLATGSLPRPPPPDVSTPPALLPRSVKAAAHHHGRPGGRCCVQRRHTPSTTDEEELFLLSIPHFNGDNVSHRPATAVFLSLHIGHHIRYFASPLSLLYLISSLARNTGAGFFTP